MEIDIVIIGINSAKTLKACIESVLNAKTAHKLHIIYVDGGSSDKSVEIAQSIPHVKVLELHVKHPTPGLGRNTGWQAGTSPLVQFLDSDTQMDPDWLDKAVPAIEMPDIGAVRGYRKELHPEKSIFNWVGDQEWNAKPGYCIAFGGDVLIHRKVLEATKGYNPNIIAGEDPELSLRVLLEKWKIVQMDALMTWHDLRMHTWTQYWKRAYRSGYAYALVFDMHRDKSTFWKIEFNRIMFRGGVVIYTAIFGFFVNWYFFISALLFLFYPRIFRVDAIAKSTGLNPKDAKTYAWYCSIVVIPQFFGALRFYLGKIFKRPLQNTISIRKKPPITK